ncbi:MAG: hypothetical protein ACD_28C00394G0002 [uncultured bacterium]|nr:MAG: hypothetical protein ACD_28C00394G0002 [uncultured bacterium]
MNSLKSLSAFTSLFLLLMLQSPLATFAASSTGFSDVQEDYPYYDAILYVQSEGIVQRYPDNPTIRSTAQSSPKF